MAQSQILDKLARNLQQMGVSATRGATSVDVASANVGSISLVDASVQSPMGGVDGSVSPFLGIGIAAPCKIKIKGAAGKNTLAAILASETDAKILAACSRPANNILVEAGDSATQLAEIPGHPDLLGMGQ
jgi:hypothetical protein